MDSGGSMGRAGGTGRGGGMSSIGARIMVAVSISSFTRNTFQINMGIGTQECPESKDDQSTKA